MTDDKLYTSLSALAILANRVQRTRLITSSTDKHYSLDSEDDFRSGCRNVSHQQRFFSELHSPGRSHYTNYWYPLIQTIYNDETARLMEKPPIRGGYDRSTRQKWKKTSLKKALKYTFGGGGGRLSSYLSLWGRLFDAWVIRVIDRIYTVTFRPNVTFY